MPAFWILIGITIVLVWIYLSSGFQELGKKVKDFFKKFKH